MPIRWKTAVLGLVLSANAWSATTGSPSRARFGLELGISRTSVLALLQEQWQTPVQLTCYRPRLQDGLADLECNVPVPTGLTLQGVKVDGLSVSFSQNRLDSIRALFYEPTAQAQLTAHRLLAHLFDMRMVTTDISLSGFTTRRWASTAETVLLATGPDTKGIPATMLMILRGNRQLPAPAPEP